MAATIRAAKQTMRRQVMSLVKAMPRQQLASESISIQRQVLESEIYRQSRNIGCYIAMENGNEVSTDLILQDILQPGSHKQLWVPYVKRGCPEMRMLLVTKEEDLEPCELFPGIFIRQPKKPDELKDILELGHMLDLLLVPGVAFDGKGARLGRGKGFYDDFLRRAKARAAEQSLGAPHTMGLCLSVQQLPAGEVPVDERDQPLDHLITPQ